MGSTASIMKTAALLINPTNAIPALTGEAAKRNTVDIPKDKANDAKDAANQQRQAADKLASEAETRRTNEEGAATAAADAQSARARQKQIAASAQGRRSTILTGPLGVVEDAPVARKTILGA